MDMSRISRLAAVVASCCILSGLPTTGRADELAASVAERLRDSGELSGYRVSVKSNGGTVWLEGRVSDEEQLAAAVRLAEASPGVERVVNRLAIAAADDDEGRAEARAAAVSSFGVPASARSLAGVKPPPAKPSRSPRPTRAAAEITPETTAGGLPLPRAGRTTLTPSPVQTAGGVRPTALRQPVVMPGDVPGLAGSIAGAVGDGQIVPGTMRFSEADGGYVERGGVPQGMPRQGAGGPGGPVEMGPGGYGGRPLPMGSTGVGAPPIPMRGDGPNMPNYAWPSYAAYPNYAALQYPTQYSPTAWPYIGPFYPYPQVPLGWRRVSLEWDDGWWWLDFDERHIHSHHR
jgi:hypothetical protein